MPYVTVKQRVIPYQVSFDDLLSGEIPLDKFYTKSLEKETNTRTVYRASLSEKFIRQYDIAGMISHLKAWNIRYKALRDADIVTLYHKFYIPKKSGGLREINAPIPEFMTALNELKDIFENQIGADSLYHTSAFAYVKGRCTIDSVKRHQMNQSRWFLKLDFSDFFGSTTLEFLCSQLAEIFPFSEIMKSVVGREELTNALQMCFLNGGLPQGTPMSPLLTNIMMIPIDYKLYNYLREQKPHMIYTRYADDILISSRYSFWFSDIQKYIIAELKNINAPFSLNVKKTRYGSSSGSNWNLGVMLNKDNKITIGHRQHDHFKAMISTYTTDKINGKKWDIHDIQVLQGLISYYRMIDKPYIDYTLKHASEKYRLEIEKMIKEDIRNYTVTI